MEHSYLDQKIRAVGSDAPTLMASGAAVLGAAGPTPTPTPTPTPLPRAAEQPEEGSSANHSAVFGALAGRYLPVRQLGEGGMGEVLLSHDSAIGRNVAIKRMKRRADAEATSQLLAEVHTTGRLEHPGIVPIYDVGQDAVGNPYFVMKYLDGEPLDCVIEKLRSGNPEYLKRYSYERRTELFMQLLRAVQYAHRQGILHLDIKPANVVVGPFGEVVLVDWGIARSVTPGETDRPPTEQLHPGIPRGFSGTPAYMSPEQVMGDPASIDHRTDTYCLSVLFYELITLHHYLTPKSTVQGYLTAILMHEPMSALQMHHQYGAPPELTNFIRPGLQKDPAQRYQTADQMVEKLQAIMDGLVPVVCPCTGIKRAANAFGDLLNAHPIWGVVTVALLVLLALFGSFELVRLTASQL